MKIRSDDGFVEANLSFGRFSIALEISDLRKEETEAGRQMFLGYLSLPSSLRHLCLLLAASHVSMVNLPCLSEDKPAHATHPGRRSMFQQMKVFSVEVPNLHFQQYLAAIKSVDFPSLVKTPCYTEGDIVMFLSNQTLRNIESLGEIKIFNDPCRKKLLIWPEGGSQIVE